MGLGSGGGSDVNEPVEVSNASASSSEGLDENRSSTAFRYALIVTAIAFLCLGVWALSPIYPDEIAFRQNLGRIAADHGVVYGLFDMCPSSIKTVPLVLKPVAWLLAETMRILSPLEMRVLSFTAVLAVVFSTVRQAAGNRNPAAGFFVLASFVGIAGASLIFVRYEFALELHLLSCLVAAARLTRPRTGALGDLGVAAGLMLSAALSVLSHPQGLLLLPLTSYFLLRLAVRRFGLIGLIAGVVPSVLFVPPALALHHFVCTEHPKIEAGIEKLGFDASNLGARHLAKLLLDGVRAYVGSFLYADGFPERFLPGVDAATSPVRATNMLVAVVVLFFGGFALCIPAVALFRCCKSFRFRPGRIALSELLEKNQPFVTALLITIPVIFLFVYDPSHNFYRNSYLNHFLAIAVSLVFASLSRRAAVRITKSACVIVGTAVGASLIANAFLFIPPLWNGYEGPSLSVFRSWPQVTRDTEELARQCKMDLQRGHIIVDDLTQAGVFSRPVTIPVTYLSLQANLLGMSDHDAAISIKANYAILRCPYFNLLGIKPQGKTGEICCYAFN
jgi:hypothetical protein